MMIDLVHGEPIRFGADRQRGVVMGSDGQLRLVEVADVGEDALLVHDAERDDPSLAFALARLSTDDHSPTPFGVFRDVERQEYASAIGAQLAQASERKGPGDLARAAALERHLDASPARTDRRTPSGSGRSRSVPGTRLPVDGPPVPSSHDSPRQMNAHELRARRSDRRPPARPRGAA